MALSLRKKSNIRVRQPLSKIMIPVLNVNFKKQIEKVQHLILHEINVKQIDFVEDSEGILIKSIKPDFKKLGPKYGKIMKAIALQITGFSQKDIARLEKEGKIDFVIEGEPVEILLSDVEIFAEDIPGWVVSNQGALTVALDITITDEFKMEGYARELVNRIQNYRKDSRLDVVDNISIEIESHPELDASFILFENFIKTETLCTDFSISQIISDPSKTKFEISEGIEIDVVIRKI